MIPPDVASSLRQLLPEQQSANAAQTQPVSPAARIADVLSNLVPGQRVMAEIQALLPNGTYRAIIAQRDVTLALPFSAKPGDSLELEVTESDGKLTLAVVAGKAGTKSPDEIQDSVATSLSRTGKLIGDLLGEIDAQGRRAPATPLNGSQPLVEAMPRNASDLAPVLKQALTQSGMFYEAHQARWAAGELSTAHLLQEPQGQHSQLRSPAESPPRPSSLSPPTTASQAFPAAAPTIGLPAEEPTETAGNPQSPQAPIPAKEIAPDRQLDIIKPSEARPAPQPTTGGAGIPADLTPLVQQQLDALATQTFAWQGQIWPGQQMHWEIEKQAEERGQRGDDEAAVRWRTRLKLDLPRLGGIAANLSLRPGGELGIDLVTESPLSQAQLDSAAAQLREQMAAAGLSLTQFSVKHDEGTE